MRFVLAISIALLGCVSVPFDRPPRPAGPSPIADLRCQELIVPSPCVANETRNVEVLGIVTAIDTYDENFRLRVGNLWIRDVDGGPWSGLLLFAPTISPIFETLRQGDLVHVRGEYVEFLFLNPMGQPSDASRMTTPEIQFASVRKIGESTPPDPIVVANPLDLDVHTQARQWVGSLVELRDVEASGSPNAFGEFALLTGPRVGRELYEIPGVAAGLRFRVLRGVVHYFFGYKIFPRGPEDVSF